MRMIRSSGSELSRACSNRISTRKQHDAYSIIDVHEQSKLLKGFLPNPRSKEMPIHTRMESNGSVRDLYRIYFLTERD